MDVKTGASLLLLLLLGLCNAHQGDDHSADNESSSSEPTEDISTTILRMNNGSSNFLLGGDVFIPRTRNSMRCLSDKFNCLWSKSSNGNVEIPFTVNEQYDDNERNVIFRALEELESKTCIRFIPRRTHRMYLSIEPRYGCFSMLGRLGDKQVLSLQRFGCVSHGIILHELLHTLGFYHEHSRSDRDQYVRINWENVLDLYKYNFQKQDTNNLNTPYDYNSIMHYGRTALGKLASETITPIPDPTVSIGQRHSLSDIDVLKINRLYQCSRYL